MPLKTRAAVAWKAGAQSSIETLSEHASFGGVQGFYRHVSNAIGLPMRFGV